MAEKLLAGAAVADISPIDSQFLAGYPHVPRWSIGIHDPLYSSALFLDDGKTQLLMIGNDILYVHKAMVKRARERIAAETTVPAGNILICSTHTHSGPIVSKRGTSSYDKVTPDCDDAYQQLLEDGIVKAGIAAAKAARPVEIGLASAFVEGIGTNRRSPDGPSDPEVPVLAVRDAATKKLYAVLDGYAMHPTVLHEDSKLVSADFPGASRAYLKKVFGDDVTFIHCMGASGNQSPRYCVKGQTFAEAERLGTILGKAIEVALGKIEYLPAVDLSVTTTTTTYPLRKIPSVADAEAKVKAVTEKFERQKADGTPRAVVRTTECDLFGAQASYALALSQEKGAIEKALTGCMPAEIMLIRIGKWNFVCWPGEIFIEFALAVRKAYKDTFVFTCSNGSMIGYIPTAQGAREGGYEASTTVFAPEAGDCLVACAKKLLDA